jgi:LysM repeat protein
MGKLGIIVISLFLASCHPQNPAPIEYHHHNYYGKTESSASSERTIRAISDEEISSKAITKASSEDMDKSSGILMLPKQKLAVDDEVVAEKPDDTKVIYHEVQAGETIEQIAEDYDTEVSDIASLNDLVPPYKLDEYQILKIKVSSEVLNKRNKEHEKELKIKPTPEPVKLSNEEPETQASGYLKPVKGDIIKRFNDTTPNGKNNGINIAAAEGAEVKAIGDGTVVYAGKDDKFGNLVIVKLKNTDDVFVAYAHMKDLDIKKDMIISKGQIIGHVGSTGGVDSPQLYLAVRRNKTPIDPEIFLKW